MTEPSLAAVLEQAKRQCRWCDEDPKYGAVFDLCIEIARSRPAPDLDGLVQKLGALKVRARRREQSSTAALVNGKLNEAVDVVKRYLGDGARRLNAGPAKADPLEERVEAVMNFWSNRPAEYCHMFANAQTVIEELMDERRKRDRSLMAKLEAEAYDSWDRPGAKVMAVQLEDVKRVINQYMAAEYRHVCEEGPSEVCPRCLEAPNRPSRVSQANAAPRDDDAAGFLVDQHSKDFTLEKAVNFLLAHNDGIYEITASKHLDELVRWLLAYLQLPKEQGPAAPEGYTLVPDRALAWLFGEEGSFEKPADARGNYWWRSRFRKMIEKGE